MKIGHRWLRDFIPDLANARQLVDILTRVGLEVESVQDFSVLSSDLPGCVVGFVKEVCAHPNADKLRIVQVDIAREQLTIVCGAKNVSAGQKVVVACVGATLKTPAGKRITIQNAVIRGQVSAGMICSAAELGLSEDHAGILVLPNCAQVGMSAKEFFSQYDDTVLEVAVTPNRGDAMSHVGVARDLIAYHAYHYGRADQFQWAQPQPVPLVCRPAGVCVDIQDSTICPRYCGVVVYNLPLTPSPLWVQNRLLAIGQKPVNIAVDCANFLLHAYGTPIHTYDWDKIAGEKIRVRTAEAGETMLFLDQVTRCLHAGDIVVCDGQNTPMCLAGVMGGAGTAVSASTKNIFVELAVFPATHIRKTALRHRLRTESAIRFEKGGTSISSCKEVLMRYVSTIQQWARQQRENWWGHDRVHCVPETGEMVDVYPVPYFAPKIPFSSALASQLAGKPYDRADIARLLSALGFVVSTPASSPDECEVAVPDYRAHDVKTPVDVLEEVLRIDGIDQIPVPEHLCVELTHIRPNTFYQYTENILEYVANQGFSEILTNPIVDIARFPGTPADTIIPLKNPLSLAHNCLRPHCVYAGLEVIALNARRKHADVKLFEYAKAYTKTKTGFAEKSQLCFWVCGKQRPPHWQKYHPDTDIYFLKSLFVCLFKKMGVHDQMTEHIVPAQGHEYQSQLSYMCNSQQLGVIAEISAQVLSRMEIGVPVYFAQLDLHALYELTRGVQPTYTEMSKFPPVFRDLAIVVDAHIPFSAIEQSVRALHIRQCREISLFDVFEDDKVGRGKKSLALRFCFVNDKRTFTDKQIHSLMDKITRCLATEHQASVRT